MSKIKKKTSKTFFLWKINPKSRKAELNFTQGRDECKTLGLILWRSQKLWTFTVEWKLHGALHINQNQTLDHEIAQPSLRSRTVRLFYVHAVELSKPVQSCFVHTTCQGLSR